MVCLHMWYSLQKKLKSMIIISSYNNCKTNQRQIMQTGTFLVFSMMVYHPYV